MFFRARFNTGTDEVQLDKGVWAPYLMLACYCLQGKQLASGVIGLLTCQSHYNVSGINTTPCARLLFRHPLDQRIPTHTCEWQVRDLSHERVGMRWSVRVDGSPFTLNGVTSSFAELNYGSVGFPCVAFHALLAARVEECSTFREAMHASANQIAFHA